MAKKNQTRPGTAPVAVRFTPEQNEEIASVAEEFQISKQDVIRLSVAAGLKAMKKIGLVGLRDFIAEEIKAPEKKSQGRVYDMETSAGLVNEKENEQ